MITKRNAGFVLIALLLSMMAGCGEKDECCHEGDTGNLSLVFRHYQDAAPLLMDTMMYVNAAGNPYLVNEIQYFISDVTLHASDGTHLLLDEWKDIRYIDTDLPETHEWEIFDDIPAGEYEMISFTFGINEEKNQSMMFVNPPESLMFWPEYLGGGYHYMKLNGKWLAVDGVVKPFDFHLGIGQVYGEQGEVTGFIQNYFEVEVETGFSVVENKRTVMELIMNVEKWFTNPHEYDHDEWGGDIMQKQQAMILGVENGWNVFSAGSLRINE